MKYINNNPFTAKSEIDNKTDKNDINSSGYEEIENGNNENYHFVLQPRAKLNFSSFNGSRLVGLLPILWMGLLILLFSVFSRKLEFPEAVKKL